MKKNFTSNKVYVGKSKILSAGRGVYAKCDIKKNEIIESSPIIEIPKHDISNLSEGILITYFFYFGRKKERSAIALGFGSLYNHSYQPNTKHKINQKDMTIDFIALKDIKKNSELTFNYSGYVDSTKKKIPLWFETIKNPVSSKF